MIRKLAGTVLVILLLLATPALAHPFGLPAFAQVAVTGSNEVTVIWTAPADDVGALAASLGTETGPDGLLTAQQDSELASSPAFARLVRDQVVIRQDGRRCPSSIDATSVVQSGVTVRAACPGRVSAVTVDIRLLTDLDDRYRTLVLAGTRTGVERAMLTTTSPGATFVLDPGATDEVLAIGPPDVDPDVPPQPLFGGSLPFEGRFVALVDQPVTLLAGLAALLVAMTVGAAHGMAPGHGKAIAAAYLVGDRGRPRDAVLLGVTVALMHTWSTLVLGVLLYTATRLPSTASLSAWLQVGSGGVILVLGVWLLLRRWRERRTAGSGPEHNHGPGDTHHHDHDHGHHLPAEAHPLSRRGLVALGAAGGLLPSPSGMLVLFTALATGRLAYGLVLIGAFSVGLAATVTAVGLAVLWGRDWTLARVGSRGIGIVQLVPIAGAVAVTGVGLVIVVRSIGALA